MTSNQQRPVGFSVHLYLPGGQPDGVKIVQKNNWTGIGLVIPRPLFGETRSRQELNLAGIYILVGSDSQPQLPRVYVGEGDPVLPRLDSHAKAKDFWTEVVVFISSSKSMNLNKAHIQYLESRMISLALASKRCALDNGNTPQAPSLSEAETTAMDVFLSDTLLCLHVLGYDFFEPAPPPAPEAVEFFLRGRGVEARGYESATGFVVRAGSRATKTEVKSIHNYMSDLRQSLVKQGVLADRGASYEVTQDYAFNSPSTAMGVLLGRTGSGPADWKTEDGRSLKSVRDSKVGP